MKRPITLEDVDRILKTANDAGRRLIGGGDIWLSPARCAFRIVHWYDINQDRKQPSQGEYGKGRLKVDGVYQPSAR